MRLRVLIGFLIGFASRAIAAPIVAQEFHLRSGGLLSTDAPFAGAATQILSVTLATGQSALLASFTSDVLSTDLVSDDVKTVLFLATGPRGMDNCAEIGVDLVRVDASGTTTVASGTLVTTLVAQRQVTSGIIIPIGNGATAIAASGERFGVQISAANRCGSARSVRLLYDSATADSRMEIAPTSETTTTTPAPTTTTSTTLPPSSCVDSATGLDAVQCFLSGIDDVLQTASTTDLGGARFVRRLTARVGRAHAVVRAAQERGTTTRRLRHIGHRLARLAHLIAHGQSKIASDLRTGLGSLAARAIAAFDAVGG